MFFSFSVSRGLCFQRARARALLPWGINWSLWSCKVWYEVIWSICQQSVAPQAVNLHERVKQDNKGTKETKPLSWCGESFLRFCFFLSFHLQCITQANREEFIPGNQTTRIYFNKHRQITVFIHYGYENNLISVKVSRMLWNRPNIKRKFPLFKMSGVEWTCNSSLQKHNIDFESI